MKNHIKIVSILLFVLIVSTACSNDNKDSENTSKNHKEIELTISAAASLQDALKVIENTYKDEHPEIKLTFNFGASGSLQQQISQGAPVDIFFTAAEEKFDLLVDKGTIAKEDRLDLLGNELVLIVPKENIAIKNFEDLEKKEVMQLSIGTPETVPAGQHAKESLEKMRLWNNIESKIVFAKDVRQVLSYVDTGNVDAGIVYKTDALIAENVKIVATADPATHPSIIYPVGIIKESKQYEAAKDFYNYLQSDAAIKIFEEFGFTNE